MKWTFSVRHRNEAPFFIGEPTIGLRLVRTIRVSFDEKEINEGNR